MPKRTARVPDDLVVRVVDELFRTQLHPEGREWRYSEVAAAVNSRYLHLLDGNPLHPTHVSKLRLGDIREPGRRTLLALCAFFQVPITRFFPELDALNEPGITPAEQLHHALQRAGLSPAMVNHLQRLIREIQLLQDGIPMDPLGGPLDAPR